MVREILAKKMSHPRKIVTNRRFLSIYLYYLRQTGQCYQLLYSIKGVHCKHHNGSARAFTPARPQLQSDVTQIG